MNLLLRALSARDKALLGPLLKPCRLRPSQPVATMGVPTSRVLFPDDLTITLSLPHPDANGVVIGVVGPEGMIGWSALLGQSASPFDAAAGLAGGNAQEIEIAAFERACRASDPLMRLILRFSQAMTAQFANTAASAIQDSVARRLARWLLMLHDRQDGDELVMTHDTLASELGIRRASVTDCLHLLEGDHIVRCNRGRIAIRDRAALETAAGAAYGSAEADYATLIAPFARRETMVARVLASA